MKTMRNYVCRLFLETRQRTQLETLSWAELGAWHEIEMLYGIMVQSTNFDFLPYLNQNIKRWLRYSDKLTDYGQGALKVLLELKERALSESIKDNG